MFSIDFLRVALDLLRNESYRAGAGHGGMESRLEEAFINDRQKQQRHCPSF